jgi:hypothetical protein
MDIPISVDFIKMIIQRGFTSKQDADLLKGRDFKVAQVRSLNL